MTSLETLLRTHVKNMLFSVEPSAIPQLSSMIRTKDGYRKAEEMILQYSIKNQISISSAIAQIEAEL